MKIYEINVSNEYRIIVDSIKEGLDHLFSYPRDVNGDIYIINHFPSVGNRLGDTDLLIFVDVLDRPGNYFRYERTNYLHNLVIGIKWLYDNNITDVDDKYFYTLDGSLDYTMEIDNEKFNLLKFSKDCRQELLNCSYFYCVKSSNCSKSFSNDFIIFNSHLNIAKVLFSACRRTKYFSGIRCWKFSPKLSDIVENYIEVANSQSEIGILTKSRINQITQKGLKTPLKVLANKGNVLTVLAGKAGSGKTLMLTRVFNEIISNNHHCRYLTFNHLLVYDIQQCIRKIPGFNSTNAYVHTLHYFFYHLSEKTGVFMIFTENRLCELMDICVQRIVIANACIQAFKNDNNQWPNNDSFWRTFGHIIESGDRREIAKYVSFFFNNILSYREQNDEEALSIITQNYIEERERLLRKELNRKVFLSDYNKVMENLYLMFDNPHDFYEKHHIKNRRDLLNLMSRMDKLPDEEYKEYKYDEFREDLEKKVNRILNWSKSVLIDEGQDCDQYEKMILMKIFGSSNLVVVSGGKDQLIRTSSITDWTHSLGVHIPSEVITLPKRNYRQKANIVYFINAFVTYYKIPGQLTTASEYNGLGRVIIDIRKGIDIFNDKFTTLRKEGKVHGCTDYENFIILIPSKGYTSKSFNEKVVIDEYDNVDVQTQTTDRQLDLPIPDDLIIWKGYVDKKSTLQVPASNQTRILYYDSCRGLEAWNVLCVDLDRFFYEKLSSSDAEKYAIDNINLFKTKEDLKKEYALRWVYMAMTRPIDTLYIKLAYPSNPFSQELINIAKGSNVEILNDSQGTLLENEEFVFPF